MPSPFPGVDPFIEASGRWQGFHNLLIAEFSKQLNATLPENYAAIVEERVELVELPSSHLIATHRRPDVAVVRGERGVAAASGAHAPPGVSLLPELEAATLTLPDYDQVIEAYIDIVALPGQELVTSIELLSPVNKSKSDGGDYLAKRAAILRRDVNLVEIDLLLGGDRLPAQEPLPAGDFYAFVSRATRRPKCEVYAWSIRRQLPAIPVPLKSGDADIALDLAEAFRLTYDQGRYDRTLRYDLPPSPALADADRAWVEQVVAATRQ